MQLQKKIIELLFKALPRKKRQPNVPAQTGEKKDDDLDLFNEENLSKIKPEERKEYDEIKKGFKS